MDIQVVLHLSSGLRTIYSGPHMQCPRFPLEVETARMEDCTFFIEGIEIETREDSVIVNLLA